METPKYKKRERLSFFGEGDYQLFSLPTLFLHGNTKKKKKTAQKPKL